MSTGEILAVFFGTDSVIATTGATWLAHRLVPPRVKAAAGWTIQPLPAVAPHPPMAPVTLPGRLSARPADRAGREAAFAEARESGKTVAEAGVIAGIAERTARDYETRRLAGLNGAAS